MIDVILIVAVIVLGAVSADMGWRIKSLNVRALEMQDFIDTATIIGKQEQPMTGDQHTRLALGLSDLANLGETERRVIAAISSKDLTNLAINAIDQFYTQALGESLSAGKGAGPAHNPPAEKDVEDMIDAWRA